MAIIFLGDRSQQYLCSTWTTAQCVVYTQHWGPMYPAHCVAKDLGLSAQNRHEIGRILQEDGKLHLFILHIFINLLKYYVRSV